MQNCWTCIVSPWIAQMRGDVAPKPNIQVWLFSFLNGGNELFMVRVTDMCDVGTLTLELTTRATGGGSKMTIEGEYELVNIRTLIQ